jgi:hypothetical protein
MSDEVLRFLRSGQLLSLHLGVPASAVRRLLGQPEDMSSAKRRPQLLKYGGLQLGIDRGFVSFIGLYFSKDSPLPTVLGPTETCSSQMHPHELTEILRKNSVGFEKYDSLTFDEQFCLRTEAGVRILFVRNCLESIETGTGEFPTGGISFP